MPNLILTDTGCYDNITEKEVIEKLTQYSVVQICAKVSEYYHILRGRPKDGARNHAALAHLAHLATIYCSIDKKLPVNLIDDESLKDLCQMVNAIDNSFGSDLSTEEKRYKYLIIKASSQNIYQFNSYYGQAIMACLLSNPKLKEYIEDYLEMPVQSYLNLVFTLLLSFNDNGYTSLEKMISNYSSSSQIHVRNILNKFSISGELLKKQKARERKYQFSEYDLYSFSILRDYPIYCIKDQYFLPIPGLLMNKIGDAIYYDIFNFYLKDGSIYKGFTEQYGYALEDTLFEIANLTLNSSKVKIYKEFRLSRKGGTLHSADISLLEKSSLILAQIKNRRPPLSIHTGNILEYKDNIKRTLIERYEQNLKVISNKVILYSDKIANIDDYKIISIIVYVGDYFYLNEEPIRSYIKHEIENVNDKYTELPAANIFMSLKGYSNLLEFSANTNKTMLKIIYDYLKYQENPQKYARNMILLENDFNDWIADKSKSSILRQPFYKRYISLIVNEKLLRSKLVSK